MDGARRAYDILRGYIGHEWERMNTPANDPSLEAFEAELARLPQPPTQIPAQLREVLTPEAARKILGAEPDESFGAIKRRFDRLYERSDPARFAKGSDEARQAANIRTRVAAAFKVIQDAASPTDRRFGSLEIE